ncbi:MAG: GNAT family N-acetyltransferase [candidate division Zixibacteria bacterium]
MGNYRIKTTGPEHHQNISKLLIKCWGSTDIVTRGKIHSADKLPSFGAFDHEKMFGLITYNIENNECEIVSLNSFRENMGIGTALIEAVRDAALKADCQRLWLITTNDNIPAIEFYKRRGFTITAVHEGAIAESRKLKPEISLNGIDGVSITDEVEMEMGVA